MSSVSEKQNSASAPSPARPQLVDREKVHVLDEVDNLRNTGNNRVLISPSNFSQRRLSIRAERFPAFFGWLLFDLHDGRQIHGRPIGVGIGQ
jgi:hypothetical protein